MKIFRFLLPILLLLTFWQNQSVAGPSETLEEIYNQQFKISESDKLKEYIPENSANSLKNIGIIDGQWKEISNLNPEKIFKEIIRITKEKISSPLLSILPIVSIMIICSAVKGIRPSINKEHMEQVLNSISALCVCVSVVHPVIKCIASASLVMKTASNFIMCYVPIMATIMLASGQAVSAATYHTLLMFAGQAISYLSQNFVLPIMNILLGISLLSCLSPTLNLNNVCNNIHKTIKSLLEFTASLFTAILTMQNIVSYSADSIGVNALKLTLNGCVPIVGGMLSEAFNTVQGCIKLLKAGTGAFGIIAGGIIFFPILIECILWVIFLEISSGISDVLEIQKISSLLKSVSKVISTMLAILIFSLVILIVSSAIMLVIGGK